MYVKDLETKKTLLEEGIEAGLYKCLVILDKSFTSSFMHLVECNKALVNGVVWHDRLGHPHQSILHKILSTFAFHALSTTSYQLCGSH